MMVSIVVSTFSSKRYADLIEIINACEKQTNKDFELLFIVDENRELAEKLQKYIENSNLDWAIIIFNDKNFGLSHNRNIGVKHAKGEICAFLDDDAIPSEKWIESIIENFKDHEIGGLAGNVQPLWEDESMAWFPEELYWMISCSYTLTPRKRQDVERGFGVNMVFRKDIIEKVGYFDEQLGIKPGNWLGGEDTDMFLRVRESGAKVVFDPNALVWHKVTKSRIKITSLMKRAYAGGKSVALMKKIKRYKVSFDDESRYLKKIIIEFYPKTIRDIFVLRKYALRKILIVTIILLCETMGFIGYRVKEIVCNIIRCVFKIQNGRSLQRG